MGTLPWLLGVPPTQSLLVETIKTNKVKPNAHFIPAVVVVLLMTRSAFSGSALNCDEVMKHLKAGASPRDLADTMSISIDKIEECQNKADREAIDSKLDREGSDETRKPLRRDESE